MRETDGSKPLLAALDELAAPAAPPVLVFPARWYSNWLISSRSAQPSATAATI